MRPIDADALKEKAVHYSETEYHFEHDAVEMDDIDNAPTVEPASPWHRVEDEMPDLLQFVIVCNDDGKFVVAQYVGYQTDSLTPWRIAYTMYDTDIYDEKECGPVRYWMPIEPPKEDA